MSDEFIRADGRKPDELRPFSLRVGILKNADGSAEIRLGKNWIIVAVYGPREYYPKFEASQEEAILRCRYHMVPFSTPERKSPKPSRREIELSKVIREALMPALILDEFPEMGIDIYIEVLQAAGSTRVSSITAASLALADAGIPMRDLVVGCSAGKVAGKIVVDLNDQEDKEGEADVALAFMPNLDKITLLQMDGQLTHEEFVKAIELAKQGGLKLYKAQIEALRKRIEEMRVLE